MKTKPSLFMVAPLAISFLLNNAPCWSQMPQQYANPNQTAMIFYPVQRGTDGQQYIYTKAGFKLSIPGLGIEPNASQIAVYKDPQNNFWYVDKNGSPTPVSTQQMQSVMAQIQTQSMQRGQAQYGQYPQAGMPPQNMYGQPVAPAAAAAPTSAPSPQTQQSGNNGSSAMMTGLAAAGGAAMGSMVTNSMYNNNNSSAYGYGGVPYGAPVYKQANGQYYYADQAGKPVYVTPNGTNAAAYSQYDKQPSTYSGQQAQSAYHQQQNEQTAAKQQNEQAAESMHKQQQNEQAAESMHKQQEVEQAAGQQNNSSERRKFRHKEESASTQSTSSGQAAKEDEQKNAGRRGRLRKDDSGSASTIENSESSGRLGGRFRQ